MANNEKMITKLTNAINNSTNVVILSGRMVFREIGLNGVTAEHIAYDIESKYGYSSNEIMTSAFLNWRVDDFYDYYKNIVLTPEFKAVPNSAKAVKKLMDDNRVTKVITNAVYGMYQKAGCPDEDIIELNGTIEKNKCPNCGKIYPSNYISKSKGVALCEDCKVVLRPGFTLYGEMMDSGKLNEACRRVEEADVLIFVGDTVRNKMFNNLLRYYEKEDLYLINNAENFGDDVINNRIYGNISEILMSISENVSKAEILEKPETEETDETDEKNENNENNEKK